jgi:hypothetical protein
MKKIKPIQTRGARARQMTQPEREYELRIEAGRIELELRRRVAYLWLGLFTLNVVCVMTIVFLVGFGLMTLQAGVLVSIIGGSVAHAAAMALTVTRYLFPLK